MALGGSGEDEDGGDGAGKSDSSGRCVMMLMVVGV